MLQLRKLETEKENQEKISMNFLKIGSEKSLVPLYMRNARKFQASNDYINALLYWNKSLANITSDDDFSYVYIQRSFIYKRCGLDKECLNNLNLAEQHNIKQNLKYRKISCQYQIQQQEALPKKDNKVDKVFKLSYASNPKMPFVIDCLQLKHNLVYGNHIITNQDLNKGDIICIENLLFGTLSSKNDSDILVDEESCFLRCYNCFKNSNLDLIRCKNCNCALFCSTNCRDEAMNIYHKYECVINNKINGVENIVRKMRSFFVTLNLYDGDICAMKSSFGTVKPRAKTVFDYDLSDSKSATYNRNLMNIFHSCKSSKKSINVPIINAIFNCHPDLAAIWKDNETFIVEFLCRHADNLLEHGQVLLRWPENAVKLLAEGRKLSRKIIGVGYYPFVELMNHSSTPNIMRHINKFNQMVLIVNCPIKKGEQLFDDYNEHLFAKYQKL